MFFKKSSSNARKKFYYTFKVTEQEYMNLRSFLKANKIPHKKRFNLEYKVSKNTLIAISLSIVLIILGIIFIKAMK